MNYLEGISLCRRRQSDLINENVQLFGNSKELHDANRGVNERCFHANLRCLRQHNLRLRGVSFSGIRPGDIRCSRYDPESSKTMKQISKRDFHRKCKKNPDAVHWEGKCYCNCRVRNYRKWLAVKMYGRD